MSDHVRLCCLRYIIVQRSRCAGKHRFWPVMLQSSHCACRNPVPSILRHVRRQQLSSKHAQNNPQTMCCFERLSVTICEVAWAPFFLHSPISFARVKRTWLGSTLHDRNLLSLYYCTACGASAGAQCIFRKFSRYDEFSSMTFSSQVKWSLSLFQSFGHCSTKKGNEGGKKRKTWCMLQERNLPCWPFAAGLRNADASFQTPGCWLKQPLSNIIQHTTHICSIHTAHTGIHHFSLRIALWVGAVSMTNTWMEQGPSRRWARWRALAAVAYVGFASVSNYRHGCPRCDVA